MQALNSAGRLLEIIQEIKKKEDGVKYRDILIEIFELESDDILEVHYKMGEVFHLISKIRDDIKILNLEDENEFLLPINELAKIFSRINLETETRSILNTDIDQAVIGLKFCALTIKRERNEKKISEEDLNEIYSEVEELYNLVLKTELPKPLKQMIINNLENIRKAFVDFKIHGIDGLIKAIEGSVGSLIINNELVKNSEEGKEIAKRIFGIATNINQLINLGKNTKDILVAFVDKFLN